MIIKRIFLRNIRSYKEEKIDFPEGSILLSGDIGSGKTSVLLAIEFALFGLQPGQRGNALLRNGEKEGFVILEFEVDGKKFLVERSLKRGKTISQERCSISYNGEKHELSPTELKNKILEILSYPQEFSKKQNLLYKFTVYTPQEEMKQIILEDSETRINTLRHIFGIDKYKKILENNTILVSKLREEKRINEAVIETIEQDKINLVTKEDELESKLYNLTSLEKELFLKMEERQKIQEEKDDILLKIEEKKKLSQEVDKTRLFIMNKKEVMLINKKTIDQLKKQIDEISKMKLDLSEINKLDEEIKSKRIEKEKLIEENLKISAEINSLKIKNKENIEIKNKITKIDICPTCLQNVDPVYKSNVINKLDSDSVENSKKIKELELIKEKITNQISKINEDVYNFEKRIQDLKIAKIKMQDLEDKNLRLLELRKTNESLENDIILLNHHLENLNKIIFELNKYDNIFELKKKDFDEAMKKERQAEIKVAELKKEIEVFSRNIEDLRERVKRAEKIKNKIDYVIKVEDWLSKNFSSLVLSIEKNIMAKLKLEFSKLFSEWFSMLVSDSFDVRIDEDFTPVIEYQGYELSYENLSGGEKTAIALAYRLSLNQVINSMLSKIKTKDLIILDEPTDGFSEQQLDKMRDVLRQLNAKQLIMVSHEQKIESFVENIIRFKKEHGISKVIAENFIK